MCALKLTDKSARMPDDLEHRILLIRKSQPSFASDEQATKQGAVLPLLGRLGWDRDNLDEVKPEFSVGERKVDYALLTNAQPLVFIEAVRGGEELSGHQEKLVDCAAKQGVKLAALTDGIVWWMYLPTQKGGWEQRRFLAIDIRNQDSDELAVRFRELLSKDCVVSGAALATAQQLHESKARDSTIREAIPKAWKALCQSPDEALLAMLAQRVERLCGHRPNHAMLAEHLARLAGSSPKDAPAAPAPAPASAKPPAKAVAANGKAPPATPDGERWTFRRPLEFHFLGEHRDAMTFKEILLGVGEILYRRNGEEFWTRVSGIRSRSGKTYFARDSREYVGMAEPMPIGESGVYVETGSSAEDIRVRCHEMLRRFGHEPAKLRVIFREAGQ
jgi:hypothetical protein